LRSPFPRILLVDDQWGYGPVSMVMSIAEQLAERAVRVYAGQGPPYEFARRGPVDRLVRTSTISANPVRRLRQVMMSCDIVVSVMNTCVARLAAQLGRPCVYVDSLLWMWEAPPDVPVGVPYCQESFPGSRERLAQWRDRFHEPEIVGPLVSRPSRGPSDDPDVTLISFGGLSNSVQDQRTLAAYANGMSQCALAAIGRRADRVVIAVGRHMIELMDLGALRVLRPDVEVVDLGHDAYLEELRRSRVLISSAGMHATYEAYVTKVPCVHLPAQNLSQVRALEVLEREGVARPLDWSHLYELGGLDAADEAAACARIGGAIHRFERDPAARRRLTDHLRLRLDGRGHAGLRYRQTAFLEAQGALGAPRVAERVLDLLESRTALPAS
jgi:hypothetical protein